MPVYYVKTKSGSDYVIDTDLGFWSRNSEDVNRIWSLKLALDPTVAPWNELNAEDGQWVSAEIPEIGKRMYITSKDTWAITTEIVSVDEKP